jgi:hypothetical protein
MKSLSDMIIGILTRALNSDHDRENAKIFEEQNKKLDLVLKQLNNKK